MNEMEKKVFIPTELQQHRAVLVDNLQILFVAHLINIVVAVITALFSTRIATMVALTNVTVWITRAIGIAYVVAFFRLAAVNRRYKTAGILTIVYLVCNLLGASLFTLVASVCSIVANWQEFHGHAETVQELDAKLARKWHNLFWWTMGVGIVVGFGATAGAVIAVLSNADQNKVVYIISLVMVAFSLAVEVFYLKYLRSMRWYVA